jgi:hypothetical protein
MSIIAASRLRGTGINPLFENSEAYYKCDGTTSGVLLDSRNSFNGELNGGITQGVTGFINDAVESDGSSLSYLSMPNNTFNENNFSLSFWMYYSNSLDFNRVILRNYGGGFVVNISDIFKVTFFNDFSGALTANSDLVLDSYNQIIVQKLNNNIKVYTNNVLKIDGNKNYSTALDADLYFGTILNGIGTLRSDNSNTFLVDEIDIRKEQYTQQQRDELYNNGNGTTI